MSSDAIETLTDSLRDYEAQLLQVNVAVSAANSDERETLSVLRDEIQQLITLTKENLLELQNASGLSETVLTKTETKTSAPDDPFAEEYALFKAELEAVQGPTKEEDKPRPADFPDIAAELEALKGMKCQAPFSHGWGLSYHNALVFHVEPAENITEMDQIQLRVMFTNPTEKGMIPCSYYLEGECRFDDEKCRFSHGEVVHLSDLKEYKEPNFQSIKGGSRVLVLTSEKDKLWYRAVVQHEIKDDVWQVKLESSGGGMVEVRLKDLLPLERDDESQAASDSLSDDSSDDLSDSYDDDGNQQSAVNHSAIVQLSLSRAQQSVIGAWEQHTRGIGSRLMEKMGYVVGTGLGPSGTGRVEPVEAVVFPPGKSLDHCMRLKAEAGGDDLIKTERKLRRLKKKQLEQQKAKYEREKKRLNVFDFLNSKLGDISAKSRPSTSQEIEEKKVLKGGSSESLNLANLQVGENIRKAEKDLTHLKVSLGRQKIGTPAHSAIASKVAHKEREIRRLQESEQRINAEQNLRKSNKKMTIF